jgi:hypothetical protein
MKATPSLNEVLEDLKRVPTVPVWPHVGVLLSMSRNGAYEAARRGDFEVFRAGRRLKVLSAPLRRKLGIEAA